MQASVDETFKNINMIVCRYTINITTNASANNLKIDCKDIGQCDIIKLNNGRRKLMLEDIRNTSYKINGVEVVRRRKALGYTQEKLSELTGLSLTVIRCLEQDRVVSGSVNVLIKLVKVLQCDQKDLIMIGE